MKATRERIDRASRLIDATPASVYRALTEPAELIAWLPPDGARGTIDAFDLRVGGEFRITLVFDTPGGKTTENTDVVRGRFVELRKDERIVWAIEFRSDDPAFSGTMTMTWMLTAKGHGVDVTIEARNVPSGIGATEHQTGLVSSLDNLEEFLRIDG